MARSLSPLLPGSSERLPTRSEVEAVRPFQGIGGQQRIRHHSSSVAHVVAMSGTERGLVVERPSDGLLNRTGPHAEKVERAARLLLRSAHQSLSGIESR